MTGEWESFLSKIETGELHSETFKNAIGVYTNQITRELLKCKISCTDQNSYTCPKCNENKILFYPKVVKCSNHKCGLLVFRTISEKVLTDKQIIFLLTSEKTPVIKGFKSKKGKLFDAALTFDKQYKVVFDFPKRKPDKRV
jgi:DNA topoisomerase-3